MPIEAIPTIYKEIRFRSKLEASYAKTMDEYRIEWSYEVIGYDLNGIRYLPDFWLPKINTFLEVKGPLIPGAEKAVALAEAVNNPDFWNPKTLVVIGDESGNIILASDGSPALFAQCEKCNKYWFMPLELSYICRNCGAWDGDHYIKKAYDRFDLRQFII